MVYMYGNFIENYIAGTGISVKKTLYIGQGQYYRNDDENYAHIISLFRVIQPWITSG